MREIVGLIVVLGLLFSSCSSDDDLPLETLNGTFTGVFEVDYQEGEQLRDSVEVTFNNVEMAYESSLKGSGHYHMEGKRQIKFQDENHWTADFDWGLILSGTYDYKYKKNKLTLTKETDMGTYEYQLVKQ